jgi:hypothetical protein
MKQKKNGFPISLRYYEGNGRNGRYYRAAPEMDRQTQKTKNFH